MSKKRIRDAAKELERAIRKHAEIVTDSAVSMKKAQRSAARLASAAELYAEAVTEKTGLDNPFLGGGQLDAGSKESLLAERDEIAKDVTGAIPVIAGSGLEADDDELDDADEAPPAPEPIPTPTDAAPWFSASPIVAEESVAEYVGDVEPATDDLGGEDLFKAIVADTSSEPDPDAETTADPTEEPSSEPGAESEPVRSSEASAEPADEPADDDPAPAEPETAPTSEAEKPYAEDV